MSINVVHGVGTATLGCFVMKCILGLESHETYDQRPQGHMRISSQCREEKHCWLISVALPTSEVQPPRQFLSFPGSCSLNVFLMLNTKGPFTGRSELTPLTYLGHIVQLIQKWPGSEEAKVICLSYRVIVLFIFYIYFLCILRLLFHVLVGTGRRAILLPWFSGLYGGL